MERHSYKKPVTPVDYLYALDDDGDILMVGGFRVITDATAWCWVDISAKGLHKIYSCYRVMAEWMDSFCQEHGVTRLEAVIKDGYDAGCRLVEHLGFTYESHKPKFFGDGDGLLYVRYYG